MEPLVSKYIKTDFGMKEISVFHEDICNLQKNIDVLVLSSFKDAYAPVEGSVIGAIWQQHNINVEVLAMHPVIDLRSVCGVWISKQFKSSAYFNRIACVEIKHSRDELLNIQVKTSIFSAIRSLFYSLMIASVNNIPIETIAIPALGANAQSLGMDIIMPPLLNECISFLKQCRSVKNIILYETSPSKAFKMAKMVDGSYKLLDYEGKNKESNLQRNPDENEIFSSMSNVATKPDGPIIFISYSSKDYDIMIKVNQMLEMRGIRTWFAPRDIILSSYAASIVKGIKNADYFMVILSESSMKSRHVMNELDLAFSELESENRLIPVKIDRTEMNDAFRYYLSRLEWYQLRLHPNGTNLTALEDIIERFNEDRQQ